MSRTFFSYSRQDKAFTLKLATDLRKAGIALWIDEQDIPPGVRWDVAIGSALKEAASLVVVLSPASVASENIKDEVSYALEHHKRVVPVLIGACEVPLRMKRLQYISFIEGYDQGVERLVAVLQQPQPLPDAGSLPAETAAVPAAETVVRKKAAAPAEKGRSRKKRMIGIGIAALLGLIYLAVRLFSGGRETEADPPPGTAATSPAEREAPSFREGIYQLLPDADSQVYFLKFDGTNNTVTGCDYLDLKMPENRDSADNVGTWLVGNTPYDYSGSDDTIGFYLASAGERYRCHFDQSDTLSCRVKRPDGSITFDTLVRIP